MAINYFDEKTSRKLSLGIFVASGTLLLSALNIISNAVISNNIEYASEVSESILPLCWSALGSLIALIFTEIGAHKETPETGGRHSKSNYYQSAFAMIVSAGLIYLIYGAAKLIIAVTV